MTQSVRAIAGLIIAALVLGCSSPSSTPSAAPSESEPAASAAVSGPLTCPDIFLRTPTGEELDLGGTWRGNDDAYWLMIQTRGCLWGTATDSYPTPNGPLLFQHFLYGTLQPDFSIDLAFANSELGSIVGVSTGHAVLAIEVGLDGTNESITLRKVGGCNAEGVPPCPDGEVSLQTTEWTRVAAEILLPAPTPVE